eukprot:3200100-Amphidinium_carterae.1
MGRGRVGLSRFALGGAGLFGANWRVPREHPTDALHKLVLEMQVLNAREGSCVCVSISTFLGA